MRRILLTAIVLMGVSAVDAHPAAAAAGRPGLTFTDPAAQSTLGAAYTKALTNLLDVNTVAYDPATYNQSGLLTNPPGTFVRAGGAYPQPWTRDAAVNSWNAASLLAPDVARNTLWSVVRRQGNGQLVVVQDDQWWDQVVWLTAYYSAFRSAARMAEALGRPAAEVSALDASAESLRSTINRYFWIAAKGTYGYLIHNSDGGTNGSLDQSEEGTGQSFALLFGIASADQARLVMQNSHVQPAGVVDVYPHFARYSDAKPGRHNVSVWPMIQGYWAEAAARSGDTARFAGETVTLAGLANASGGFSEIYNFRSGAPDGGWQTGSHWGPLADQTWSATAYLRMVYSGLFGLSFTATALGFRPTLPAGWGDVRLTGLRYRGATLDIALHGAGSVVSDLRVDGASTSARSVPATLTGAHTVDITLTGGAAGPVRGFGNLCLDSRNAGTGNGTPVQLWGCNGSNAQQWTSGPGQTLRVLGKCLDASNGGTANGTNVQLWDCNSSGTQVWVPRPDGSLRNPQSGKCLDDPGASTAWGTQMQIRDCSGAAAQRFFLP